ncbi:MAG: hypothetical protein EOO02_02685 [Chitinophagaceae bacterium]|nr:MAG: hypothetical protein EOO02_02685 [Chitinophagaceae bacterium]
MTSRITTSFFLLLVVSVALFSCKKDKDDSKPRKELIVGSWQLKSQIENPAVIDYDDDGVKDVDATKGTPSCYLDNIYIFSADGKLSEDEGGTKCDPDDAQVSEFSVWALSPDETKLLVAGNALDIKEITSTTMILSYTDTEDGTAYTGTVTYTRK